MVEQKGFNMSTEDLKTLLECSLRNYEKDDDLVVTEVKESQSTNVGDGFMSEIIGVEVIGTRGSGELYNNNLIVKRLPNNAMRVQFSKIDKAFKNEALVYCDIIPKIPEFSLKVPKCYHAGENNIVLENLKARGYKMPDKCNLDVPQTELVMKAIGLFHASTYHMRLLDEFKFSQITSEISNINRDINNTFMVRTCELFLLTGIENVKVLHDESITSGLAKLESYSGKLMSTLSEFHQSDFTVLGHGDFIPRNVLFQYENDVVQDVKIIDFQMITLMSPAIDVWTFLYTSLSADLLNAHCDSLISTYCESFKETLKKLNTPEDKIPSDESLKKEFSEKELFGFFITILYLPANYMDLSKMSFDLDKLLSDPKSLENLLQGFINKDYGERVAALIRRCQDRNIL